MAIAVFNLLGNGMGGLDWAGLEVVVAKFGIDDVDALIDRLSVIKRHKGPTTEDAAPAPQVVVEPDRTTKPEGRAERNRAKPPRGKKRGATSDTSL